MQTPCRIAASCAGDAGVDETGMKTIGEEIAGCRKAILPLSLDGHWALLVVDNVKKRCRFVDTMEKTKVKIMQKKRRAF